MPGTTTFVHPTKTGGTTIARFLKDIPGVQATDRTHSIRVHDVLNDTDDGRCLVVLRDPLERAKSMYRYYRNGSDIFDPKRKESPLPFDTFWATIGAGKDPILPNVYMWDAHIRPQTWWIEPKHIEDPRVHVVLNNETSLRESLFRHLDALSIPYDPDTWTSVNVSTYRDPIHVSEATMRVLKMLYQSDFDLWNSFLA